MDKVIYTLRGGKMTFVANAANAEKSRFLIVCDYGDMSGFRTLKQWMNEIDHLEYMASQCNLPDNYYQIVERS